MERLSISKPTAIGMFMSKGSPAFKVGGGRGHWRVDIDKLELFLQKKVEKYKG
jgi:hypothetical protein